MVLLGTRWVIWDLWNCSGLLSMEEEENFTLNKEIQQYRIGPPKYEDYKTLPEPETTLQIIILQRYPVLVQCIYGHTTNVRMLQWCGYGRQL